MMWSVLKLMTKGELNSESTKERKRSVSVLCESWGQEKRDGREYERSRCRDGRKEMGDGVRGPFFRFGKVIHTFPRDGSDVDIYTHSFSFVCKP